MSPELPVGFQWRRPGLEDAEAIFAVIDSYNTPLVGSPDIMLAEVGDELSEPGFDPDNDAWLVRNDAGVDVAYGWAAGCAGRSRREPSREPWCAGRLGL